MTINFLLSPHDDADYLCITPNALPRTGRAPTFLQIGQKPRYHKGRDVNFWRTIQTPVAADTKVVQ